MTDVIWLNLLMLRDELRGSALTFGADCDSLHDLTVQLDYSLITMAPLIGIEALGRRRTRFEDIVFLLYDQ